MSRLPPAAVLQRGVPVRLVAAVSAESVATGIFLVTGLVYFARHIHLPADRLGVAMTAAQLLGVVCGTPVGYLVDLLGTRRVLVAAAATQASAMLGYLAVSGVGQFFAVTAVVTVTSQGAAAARGALIAAMAPRDQRARERAWLRTAANVGIGAGAGIGAVALQLDDRAGYVGLFAASGVLLLMSAGIAATLAGHLPPSPAGRRVTLAVIRDRRYLTFLAGSAVMGLHYGLFEVALPLWVVLRTAAPRWSVGLLIALNTGLVAAFQIRTARRIIDPRSAGQAMRAGGLFLLGSFVLFGLAGQFGALGAALCLIVAMVVYTRGEMSQAAAAWTLSYEIAPYHLHGQYQGAFQAAEACGVSMAPVVTGAVILPLGFAGWLGAGAAIAVAAVAVRSRRGPPRRRRRRGGPARRRPARGRGRGTRGRSRPRWSAG